MPALTAANVAEIAAWMRRWRYPLAVNFEPGRLEIVAEQPHGTPLIFDRDAVRRLLLRGEG